MLPDAQKTKFEAFFQSTAENGLLDSKTTTMVQLAVSFAIGCYP